MTTMLILITLVYAILCWQNLRWGLMLLVATLPSYLLRLDVAGIPTTLLELMVIAFVIVWLIKRKPSIQSLFPISYFLFPTALLPIALLLLAATISVFIAPDQTAAVGIWKAYFIEPIVLFFIIRYELTRGNVDTQDIFKSLSLSALILSIIAILQFVTGVGIPIPWDIEGRVTSIFDYPNALGLYLGPIVIISALQSIKVEAKKRWFWIITTLLSFSAIVLAQSEAAIVAVIATLLIAGLFNKPTRKYFMPLVALAILVALTVSPVRQKLTLQDFSGQVRLTQWSETADMLQDNWLLGAGLSGYPTVFEPYHQATHIEIFQYPHSILLNFWVELGLLGIIAITWLGYIIARHSITPRLHHSTLLATLALIEILIHGLVDVPYFKNDLAILTWIFIAIALAYAGNKTHQKTK